MNEDNKDNKEDNLIIGDGVFIDDGKHRISIVEFKSNMEKLCEKLCEMHDIFYCKKCNDYTFHYKQYEKNDVFHMRSYTDEVQCQKCGSIRIRENPLI